MVDGTSSHLHDDDDDDNFAALDFPVSNDDNEQSVLDAVDEYVPRGGIEDDDDGPDAIEAAQDDQDDDRRSPLFAVSNPAGTVTVSAYLDGRVQGIDLTAKVTTMTEAHLAEEILVIADLARQKARSAQYAFISEAMRELGQDNAATRDFLTRELELPSPADVIAATAEVFASRYTDDHD